MRTWLREFRTVKGFSQKELAVLLKISPQSMSFIESGERQKDMAFSLMKKLSETLEIPLNVIINRELDYKSNN